MIDCFKLIISDIQDSVINLKQLSLLPDMTTNRTCLMDFAKNAWRLMQHIDT